MPVIDIEKAGQRSQGQKSDYQSIFCFCPLSPRHMALRKGIQKKQPDIHFNIPAISAESQNLKEIFSQGDRCAGEKGRGNPIGQRSGI